MNLSLAQKILRSQKPFVFYHTHEVTRVSLQEAIDKEKSMDLDICVDETGIPYLGHSKEYHEKTYEPWAQSMPLWEAVALISKANIPVMVDCKHYKAWPYVEEVVAKIGPTRCLVHSFIFEFDFYFIRQDEYYVRSEWSLAKRLKDFKTKFPTITTTASARGLPNDFLVSNKYEGLLHTIKKTLLENQIDTLCLNTLDNTFSDKILSFFLKDNIIPHVMINNVDISKFMNLYIGETDFLNSASKWDL